MADARVPQVQPEGAQPEPAPRVSVSSSADEVSYENVTPAQQHQLSSQILDAENSQKPYTVYSIVQAPNATESVNARPEPVTSQSINQSEAEEQVSTVYSVLQNPKKA